MILVKILQKCHLIAIVLLSFCLVPIADLNINAAGSTFVQFHELALSLDNV